VLDVAATDSELKGFKGGFQDGLYGASTATWFHTTMVQPMVSWRVSTSLLSARTAFSSASICVGVALWDEVWGTGIPL